MLTVCTFLGSNEDLASEVEKLLAKEKVLLKKVWHHHNYISLCHGPVRGRAATLDQSRSQRAYSQCAITQLLRN